MKQEVKFQGLSHSPSDYDAQDGELGTCLNLINEDGSLKPVPKPETTETFTLPKGASIELVHKVTHESTIHSHYIVRKADDTWYWTEKGGDGTQNAISLGGFKVNAVTAVGNILCFVGDSKTLYAYWKDTNYVVFDLSELTYKIEIINQQSEVVDVSTQITEAEFENAIEHDNTFHYLTLTRKGASIMFNALDALFNKELDDRGDEWFKYTVFGVIAIQLYDGSYFNISTPFILSPEMTFNKFWWRADTKAVGSNTSLHTHNIQVSMYVPEEIDDIIRGVDVFLTQPESFIDTGKKTKPIRRTYFYQITKGLKTETKDVSEWIVCDAFNYLDEDGVYDAFDNKTFYHSVHIDKNKFSMEVPLKRITQAEEALSLADMKRGSVGGCCAITYNNRLHIGNVKQNVCDNFSYDIFEKYYATIPKSSTMTTGTFASFEEMHLCLNDYKEGYANASTLTHGNTLRGFIKVAISGNNLKKYVYYDTEIIQIPMSPILAFPSSLATEMTIYFHDYSGNYYKKTMPLKQSNNFGISYYINISKNRTTPEYLTSRGFYTSNGSSHGGDDPFDIDFLIDSDASYRNHDDAGLPAYPRSYRQKLYCTEEATGSFGTSEETKYIRYGWDSTKIDTGDFTKITKEEYEKELSHDFEDKYTTITPNVVKVSEAENPLVFPAKNTVQVGSSIVNALAANTRPISEGQFGEAPLYAFTDEGVWMLMVGTEGSYDSRQPANREICSNPKGILQIDDAVLFPTERGIMMQRGRESECITDALDGYPFDFTQLYKPDFAKKVLAYGGIAEEQVRYVRFHEFLQGADMIYDYYDSRIILFNPSQSYAYVYSLKSKQWGTMANVFKKRVNIYPESYAVNSANQIVNVYVKEPTADVPYFLCSRPLGLGNIEVHKTMFATIARGYFRPAEKGKCGMVLYGSNDLFHWFNIKTSVSHYLRGMAGSPYKYFRIALTGSLAVDESISGASFDFQERWQNKLR